MTRYCWVWWARTVPDATRLLPVLDDGEQARYESYDEARQLRFGSGRLVAKSVVGEMLGLQPAQVRFDATCTRCGGQHGRPRLAAGLPPLEVSIATTAERVVVAVMNGCRIGVDVLAVDDTADVQELIARDFHELERIIWGELAEEQRHEAYFRVCVRKHAALKALGVLAEHAPNELSVSGAYEDPDLVSNPDPSSKVDAHGSQLFDMDPGDGHVAALAVLSGNGVAVQELTWRPMTEARGRLRLV